MFQQFLTSLGRLYRFVMSLIIALILGITTWGCWEMYREARLQDEFAAEGHPVTINIIQADQRQRSWRDILSHSTYLTGVYRGKRYTVRFVMDSSYVGAGDRVRLLYHAGYDALMQPEVASRFDRSTRKSRLIRWTTIREFSDQNRWLLLCLLLSTASLFVISGLIVSVIPIPFLQTITRFVFITGLGIAAGFFTYDTWAYFPYYQHIKTNGRAVVVKVLDTNQRSYGRHSGRYGMGWYRYDATIRYQHQTRIIPLSRPDFDALKPADSLRVLYDASVDDFMPVDYTPEYSLILFPLTLWLITCLLLRPAFGREPENALHQP